MTLSNSNLGTELGLLVLLGDDVILQSVNESLIIRQTPGIAGDGYIATTGQSGRWSSWFWSSLTSMLIMWWCTSYLWSSLASGLIR
ncbi:hypothetical protein B9Z55_016227 [Caenorhabditis nigoni]|uniref:Uncharacterized protein n=1 Tax=Caenorhabditis nigoni TaxID=1611254 RepID=A0A2G5UEM5_9PELO|nr:hypothetical protein B9Z55_016227 [Caenorhabditis nigoni]